MNVQELIEKIKSDQASYEELLKWCSENKDTMNLKDYNEFRLYNTLINQLFKFKIGEMNREETSIFIKFFATKLACELKIDDKVSVEVLDEEKYKERFKSSVKDIGLGICVHNQDGTHTVAYNVSEIEKNINGGRNVKLVKGLQTIFHEIRHAYQNFAISQDGVYNKSLYIMAMESVIKANNYKFYKENYDNLLIENDAEKAGLELALSTIKERNPKLYTFSQAGIEEKMKEYDNNFYDSDMVIYGSKASAIKALDAFVEVFVSKNPEVLKQYPILKVAYKENGERKDILQMLQERETLLTKKPKDRIDELYQIALNQRFFTPEEGKGTKDELEALDKWIEETGTEDEFVYDLIRFRLDRSELTGEEKQQYIDEEKAKRIREKKQNISSISEQEWLEEMQSCYSESTKIQNYAGKQKQIIKDISEQLRKKDEKENEDFLGK